MRSILLGVWATLAAGIAFAGEGPAAPGDFVPLFDGKTFDGWEGNRKVFRIEDGAIVGGSLEKPLPHNEFLCTTKEYGDFELRLKFKILGRGANAGVQVRTRRIPNHHEVVGYQADLADGYWGCLYDESRRGKLTTPPAPQEVEKFLKRDQWNEYVIRCEQDRVQLWINGYKTADFIEKDPAIPRKGVIGLQIHGGPPSEAWYKDIVLRELPGVARPDAPNVVIVFTDDQGYQDVGCFGSPNIETPNLDRMAREGIRFTSFYVAQAVCSASRAALLTGCYPNRIGILGALGPNAQHGIADEELTLAEVVKRRGYATAAFGKWHLGHHPKFLPTRHGFDEYFGLPYSNDMWPRHPTAGKQFPPLPLIEGEKVIQEMPDQRQLTTWYTERAVKFIENNRNRPFLLYLAHSMPHVPLHVSSKFQGKSPRGLYGDVIMEIDWSVGQILDALKRVGIDDRTLVIFTSDNGPWLVYGDHGGSAQPLREGKGTTFEGGVRVPCIMRWPGKIPAGTTTNELAATIDLLPTIARLVGADLPSDRIIDGKDIWPLMSGQAGAKSPHEAYYYYWNQELQAVRSGRWKLHLPHAYPSPGEPRGGGGKPGRAVQKKIDLALFDLEADVGETTDVAAQHPDVVQRLETLAEQARQDLGDSRTQRAGRNVRPAGKL
jgi:arylsulfatase A